MVPAVRAYLRVGFLAVLASSLPKILGRLLFALMLVRSSTAAFVLRRFYHLPLRIRQSDALAVAEVEAALEVLDVEREREAA
jgi:hypothetical protein